MEHLSRPIMVTVLVTLTATILLLATNISGVEAAAAPASSNKLQRQEGYDFQSDLYSNSRNAKGTPISRQYERGGNIASSSPSSLRYSDNYNNNYNNYYNNYHHQDQQQQYADDYWRKWIKSHPDDDWRTWLRRHPGRMTCRYFPRMCHGIGSPGRDCCQNRCVDVKTDHENCGACGHRCKYSEICCKGSCVNPMHDRTHCGWCGNKCKKGGQCYYGMCSYA